MKQNLIKKIQEKVKWQSVNSLGNLYPDDIIDWLEVSEEEAKKLIEFLHNQRVLFYKYRIKCNCGERNTVYENTLNRGKPLYCNICGHVFSRQDLEEGAEIIYEIDKEELLSLEDKKTEFRVFFIGSSSGMVDYMDEIALKLEQMNETPLLWNDGSKGIFVPGTSTIDSLIEITERVKAAIFIFNKDDKVWFNGRDSIISKSEDAVRDNVLFEYGLFMGTLGKGKVCFICKGKPHIASDLQGITYIDGDLGDAYVKANLKSWVERIKQI